MSFRLISVSVDENGDIIAWKAVAGAKRSHLLAKAVFPQYKPNYSLDKGVAIRIKAFGRPTASFPLDSDYATRK